MGNAKDTKNRIILSAIAIISQKGYHQASMDEIALEANVAKGTLYYYFKSKEEVFNQLIFNGIEMIRDEIIAQTSHTNAPIQQLRILTRVLLQLIFDKKNLFKIIISQLWGDELRQVELRKKMDESIAFIENYISACAVSGDLKTDNLTLKAYNYFGLVCTTALFYLMKTECITVDDQMISSVIDQL